MATHAKLLASAEATEEYLVAQCLEGLRDGLSRPKLFKSFGGIFSEALRRFQEEQSGAEDLECPRCYGPTVVRGRFCPNCKWP